MQLVVEEARRQRSLSIFLIASLFLRRQLRLLIRLQSWDLHSPTWKSEHFLTLVRFCNHGWWFLILKLYVGNFFCIPLHIFKKIIFMPYFYLYVLIFLPSCLLMILCLTPLMDWNFLVGCSQRILVIGTISDWVPVMSGVLHRSILVPLLFILFIKDTDETIDSEICLFADDCIIYYRFYTKDGHETLEQDLNKLGKWSHK